MKNLNQKLLTSFCAVFPISIVVIVLGLFNSIEASILGGFVLAAVMLVIGMTFFTLGADVAIMPIGELLGIGLTKSKKIWLVLLVAFITGLLITIAEPGLMVLGQQVDGPIGKWRLVLFVGVGVGVYLVVAMFRTLFKIPLNRLFFIFYGLVFAIAIVLTMIGKASFLTVAFDSAGATTGAITVPFIMAYGIGIAAIKGEADIDDNFGLIALCSIGPIISVLFLSLISGGGNIDIARPELAFHFSDFYTMLPGVLTDVAIPLIMIVTFFLICQVLFIRVSYKRLIKIFIGSGYTLFGLTVFLLGANVGFMPIGNQLGELLGASNHPWILIPIGFLVGCLIVVAEPSIHVLNAKVEEISDRTIKKSTMLVALMVGIGLSIALAMVRVLFAVSIWWIIAPGYLIALGLMFFVPKVFTAVAFDSGGVASGPMTSAFLLPLAIGACGGKLGNADAGTYSSYLLDYGFGVIALVAMTPLITIQIVGLVAMIKQKRDKGTSTLVLDDEIIYLG